MKMLSADNTLSADVDCTSKSRTVICPSTMSENTSYRRKIYFNNQHSLQSIVQSSTSSSESMESPSISISYGSKEEPSVRLPYENSAVVVNDNPAISSSFDSPKSSAESERKEILNLENKKFPRKSFLIDSLLEERQKRLAAAAAMINGRKENTNVASSRLNYAEDNVTDEFDFDLVNMKMKNDYENNECENNDDTTANNEDSSEPMDLKFKRKKESITDSMEQRDADTLPPHSPNTFSEPESIVEDPSTSFFPADPSPPSATASSAPVMCSTPSKSSENCEDKSTDAKKHNETSNSSPLLNLVSSFVNTINNSSSDELKRQSFGQTNSILMNEYLNRLKLLQNTIGLNSLASATCEMGSNSAANTARAHSYNPVMLLQMANSTNNGTQSQFFQNNNNMAIMAKQHAVILQHQATLALRNRLSAAAAIAAVIHGTSANANSSANSTSIPSDDGSKCATNSSDISTLTSQNNKRITPKELVKNVANDVPYTVSNNSKTTIPTTTSFSTVKSKFTTYSTSDVTRPYANSLSVGRTPTISSSGRIRTGLPHRSSNAKKYRCDICEKTFSRSNTLITHKRIHTGEKPFRCEHCGRAFRQPGNLTRHAYTHTTVKPFVCAECGKAFNRASNLHTHMRVHNLDQTSTPNNSSLNQSVNGPFSISNQFDTNRQLSLLLGTAAAPQPSSCMTCGKSFEHKLELRTHRCQGRSLLI